MEALEIGTRLDTVGGYCTIERYYVEKRDGEYHMLVSLKMENPFLRQESSSLSVISSTRCCMARRS